MKKSKQEAEKDLLARNHRRLNKAIDELLNENKSLRKRLDASLIEINNLRDAIRQKNDDNRLGFVHTVVHSLAGSDMTSDRIAERAIYISEQVVRRMMQNAR